MDASDRIMNFGSGPGALPLPALQAAQAELLDVAGSGMSIMEHSHRGAVYDAVHEEARALFRELLDLPSSHEVLFFQGGASEQFATIPMNFQRRGAPAGYLVHGMWGEKALQEANAWSLCSDLPKPASVSTVQDERFVRAPSAALLAALPETLGYLHTTTNETIHGVQWRAAEMLDAAPKGIPLVCDMSSDFLSHPVDLSRFALVYAGAQKNVGPSGLVVAVVNVDFAKECRKDLPRIFRYDAALKERSLVNTPPVFSVYMARNVLRWLKAEGGVPAMAERNAHKAKCVYDALESNAGFYHLPVEAGSRSAMNVVFGLPSAELEKRFLTEAKAAGMVGLAGHRSVGGMRAALYNAIPVAWAEALSSFLVDFAKRAG